MREHMIKNDVGVKKQVARPPSDATRSTTQEEEEEDYYDEEIFHSDDEYDGDENESLGRTEKEENAFGGLGMLKTSYTPTRPPRADASNINTARHPRYQEQQQQRRPLYPPPPQFSNQPDQRLGALH